MPAIAHFRGLELSIRRSSSLTSPLSSGKAEEITFRRVVLPAPLGPISPTISPDRQVIDTSRNA